MVWFKFRSRIPSHLFQHLHPARLTWNLRIHHFFRGKSSSKPSFSGSMLIFGGVFFFDGSTLHPWRTPIWLALSKKLWATHFEKTRDEVCGRQNPKKITESKQIQEKCAWRTIPVSKWLITMVIVSPLNGVIPLINGRTSWLVNRGDPNNLQVLGWTSKWWNHPVIRSTDPKNSWDILKNKSKGVVILVHHVPPRS